MPNSNGKITAPVDVIGDVAYVLGSSSGDVGTLCTHSDINQWARCKPYCHSSPATTDANRKSRNCGLTMKRYNNLQTMFNDGVALAVGTGMAWIYDKPRGYANNELFRILDFDGYDSQALPPFGSYDITPNPAYELDSVKFNSAAHVVSLDGIMRADLAGDSSNGRTTNYKYYNMAGYNLGIGIRRDGTTSAPICKTFDEGESLDIPKSVLSSLGGSGTQRTYHIVAFLTSTTLDWSSSEPTGEHFLFPSPHFILTYNFSDGIMVTGALNSFGSRITFTVYSLGGSRSYRKIEVSDMPYASSVGEDKYVLDENGSITSTEQTYTITKHSGLWPTSETLTMYFRYFKNNTTTVTLEKAISILIPYVPPQQ